MLFGQRFDFSLVYDTTLIDTDYRGAVSEDALVNSGYTTWESYRDHRMIEFTQKFIDEVINFD